MAIIMIIVIAVLIYIANLLYNIREDISCNTHNTAKICDHLYEIKNGLDELIKNKQNE